MVMLQVSVMGDIGHEGWTRLDQAGPAMSTNMKESPAGESGRRLKLREGVHTGKDKTSSLVKHVNETGHKKVAAKKLKY